MKLKDQFTKLRQLRTSVPGMRERYRYEESFGMPREEANHLVMPTAWQTRVLAEIEYVLRLAEIESDEAKEAEMVGVIEAAMDYLLEQIRLDSALTDRACEEAEKLLLPLAKEAASYELILAAHAHLDMNWMWGWDETVSATINTFRTMLRLMDEYPDFHFSQSQASCYKIVEDFAPELKPAIMERIREGRWEITASAWVETDKNMPSTDSLLKHIHYTKKYLSEHWGVDPASLRLDFSPDTFGHSEHVPTLNNLGDVRWYYHCRGSNGDDVLYRWQAPSGKEVLVYREPYWYNSAITPLIGTGLPDISRRSGGLRTGLIVYGVGDHGGGPTRRDIEKALDMMKWPVFPKIRFGRFSDFFEIAEQTPEKYPLRTGERNFIFAGCYTTQSEIKKGNRRGEMALGDAELWASLAHLYAGTEYHEEIFESAWQKLLFTHFHDILTGSNTPDSKVHALGLYQEVLAAAESRTNQALEAIASRIDTAGVYHKKSALFAMPELERLAQSEGAGPGYGLSRYGYATTGALGGGLGRVFNIFNGSAFARKEYLEITVWDWTGDIRRLNAADADGKPLSFVLIDHELQTYWDHKYFRILVEADVPAFGYTSILIYQDEMSNYPIYYQPPHRTSRPFDNVVLENSKLRAEFSSQNGRLISLIDKVTGAERITSAEGAGMVLVDTERRSSNAWNIGRYIHKCSDFRMVEMRPFGNDKELRGFECKQVIRNSSVNLRVSLTGEEAVLRYEAEIDWQEATHELTTVPLLIFHIPLEAEDFICDVPGGFVRRAKMNLDMPASGFTAADHQDRSTVLISESKYGYRADDSGLAVSLLNATYSPDPYPEYAKHKTRFAIGVCDNKEANLAVLAEKTLRPLRYYSAAVHEGDMPATDSLLDLELNEAKLVNARTAGGKLLLTVSAASEEGKVSIGKSGKFASVTPVNLALNPLEDGDVKENEGRSEVTLLASTTVILALDPAE